MPDALRIKRRDVKMKLLKDRVNDVLGDVQKKLDKLNEQEKMI